MGLNSRQIEIISNATPKREYYVVSPAGRRKVQLALGPVTLAFVGAPDKESITRIRELSDLHGPDKWQEQWILERAA